MVSLTFLPVLSIFLINCFFLRERESSDASRANFPRSPSAAAAMPQFNTPTSNANAGTICQIISCLGNVR